MSYLLRLAFDNDFCGVTGKKAHLLTTFYSITKTVFIFESIYWINHHEMYEQAALNHKQPSLFRYGNKRARKLSSYARPLLAGTEDTTTRVRHQLIYPSIV